MKYKSTTSIYYSTSLELLFLIYFKHSLLFVYLLHLSLFQGVRISLYKNSGEEGSDSFEWGSPIAETVTNGDGRGGFAVSRSSLSPGVYKTIFYIKDYFEALGQPTFYPQVDIIFRITDTNMHHHIPLLLSPYGYSTYRGS